VVSFHADSVAGLRAAFEEAVDDYLETCAKLGKA
jgi:predicted HicB family RNase H-like nuclease